MPKNLEDIVELVGPVILRSDPEDQEKDKGIYIIRVVSTGVSSQRGFNSISPRRNNHTHHTYGYYDWHRFWYPRKGANSMEVVIGTEGLMQIPKTLIKSDIVGYIGRVLCWLSVDSTIMPTGLLGEKHPRYGIPFIKGDGLMFPELSPEEIRDIQRADRMLRKKMDEIINRPPTPDVAPG